VIRSRLARTPGTVLVIAATRGHPHPRQQVAWPSTRTRRQCRVDRHDKPALTLQGRSPSVAATTISTVGNDQSAQSCPAVPEAQTVYWQICNDTLGRVSCTVHIEPHGYGVQRDRDALHEKLATGLLAQIAWLIDISCRT
jgi:hypothetical protein